MLVELLFFPGCPHVDAACEQLRRAFSTLGETPAWVEHDVTAETAPAHVRGYGSPTILVEGRDVTGAPATAGLACRVYLGSDVPGAPPLRDVLAALRELEDGPLR
jgi:hypothetical protein